MTRNSTYKLNDSLPNENNFKLYHYETFKDDDGERLYFRNVKTNNTWGNKCILVTYYDKDNTLGTPSFVDFSKQFTADWNRIEQTKI